MPAEPRGGGGAAGRGTGGRAVAGQSVADHGTAGRGTAGRAAAGPAAAGPDRGWTGVAGLRAASRTAWIRGTLLRELLEPTGAYPRRRALKKPTAAQLRTDYGAARAWAAELFDAAGDFTLETVQVGRTTIGANDVPAVAVFATVRDEMAFAGKTRDADRFLALAARLEALDPLLRGWALKRPLDLLELGERALTAGRVAVWLRDNPSPGVYVRQLSLPGVHTKFVETHRKVIDAMAATLAPATEDDGVVDASGGGDAESEPAFRSASTPAARFAERHGFLHPPERVRFRALDPGLSVLGSARDIAVTAEAFGSLELPVDRVLVTENLVNFLALPEAPRTLALFGGGYGFSALRDAAWLGRCEVHYWGDLDTHGFRILDQLRSVHPHVSSLLMDEETLLAHRDAWGKEPSPSRAALGRLTEAEAAVYRGLQENVHGPAVRLEQELIRWEWVLGHLP